jgi:hypothetical protein
MRAAITGPTSFGERQPLGGADWLADLEARTGRRLIPGKRGPKLPGALKALGEDVALVIRQRVAFVDSWSAGQWVGDYARIRHPIPPSPRFSDSSAKAGQ